MRNRFHGLAARAGVVLVAGPARAADYFACRASRQDPEKKRGYTAVGVIYAANEVGAAEQFDALKAKLYEPWRYGDTVCLAQANREKAERIVADSERSAAERGDRVEVVNR